MKLSEVEKLPDLVDGRDVFLQANEVIKKAKLRAGDKHVYVSISNVRRRGKIKYYSTFEKPESPTERWTMWVPEDQLEFYD